MWAILSVLVENKPGILFKVTHMFRSRNFNIDSISVGITDNPNYSRMTITSYGDEKQITQICLLYTSPSPRDGLLSRMPSSA